MAFDKTIKMKLFHYSDRNISISYHGQKSMVVTIQCRTHRRVSDAPTFRYRVLYHVFFNLRIGNTDF